MREAAKTPCHSTPERPSSESDTTLYRITRRPLARVGGLFVARLDRHRSLKTQQRTENDEAPRPRFGVGEGLHRPPVLLGETVFPSMPCETVMRCPRTGSRDRTDRHLSSSSREDNSLSVVPFEARCRRQVLHGEFDPGSGRTLAARLTHASRARTRTSVLGTAANGCVSREQPAPKTGTSRGNLV